MKKIFLSLKPAISLRKRLFHRCSLVNFVKFLGTSLFIEQLWWLLLYVSYDAISVSAKTLKINWFTSIVTE